MTEADAIAADPHAETLATLARAFGEGTFKTFQFRDNIRLHVPPDRLIEVLTTLKRECGFGALAELALEVAKLHNADSVLAGDRPVELDRPSEDLIEGGAGPVNRSLVGWVEDRGGMEVPVPRVPERADRELVALGNLLDVLDHFSDA